MKKALLCLTFLSIALLCHAQKNLKNEVSLGYLNAGEFFDTSAFKISPFTKGKNISLSYTRLFGKKLSVGLSYTQCAFNYLPALKKLERNTIEWREQKTFSAAIGFGVSKWSVSAKVKAGIRYNFIGTKMEYYGSSLHSGGWLEGYGAGKDYGKLGAKLGASIQHPILWRFFGELDCEYARMFSGADRNQLLLSYRIGFKF